ncbi:hypothetical protein VRRI112168_02235 [Vreelandella rituensis]|uniref:hypothetical protein n=1 Tax=Vreelandella rituensis TaxID=2282306 RepID=UPI0026CC8AC3
MPTSLISVRLSAWLRPLIVGLAGLMLSGCFYANTSQVPIGVTYPYTEQQRMQAAHHWEVLARHEAAGILRNERVRFLDLHVPQPDGLHAGAYSGGEFDRGFRSLLTSELVSRGANLTTQYQPSGAEIQVEVEVVEHRDRDYIRPPFGTYTALTAGVAVATIPFNQWSEPALALIPAAMVADTVSGSWTHTGPEEVIVTTQVVNDARILYSSSNIYYINGGDRRHYAPHRVAREPASPTISVTDSW